LGNYKLRPAAGGRQRQAGSKLHTEDYQLAAGSVKPAAPSFDKARNDGGQEAPSEQSYRVRDFKKLQVWHKAHALALSIDRLTKRIRGSQYASFKNQIFRAATSIPANIAEGRRRETDKDFARFLSIAAGSSSELESHLIFARDAKIIGESEFTELVSHTIEVRKMLCALMKRLSGE
jgi:four helix bundle protein